MIMPFHKALPPVSALLSVAMIGVSFPAAAQGIDTTRAMQTPEVQAAISVCMPDRSRLCASVIPGGGRIVKCLVQQQDSLSPPCKDAMMKARDALVTAGVEGAANLPR